MKLRPASLVWMVEQMVSQHKTPGHMEKHHVEDSCVLSMRTSG